VERRVPVVTFQRRDLVPTIGQEVPLDVLAERMPMLGGDLDRVADDSVTIEWFPNRPDLLMLEGTGRALRAFLGIRPGLPSYKVEKARTELRVDPSVQAVRPHAALCLVRGVPVDDAYVATLVEAQEKLTFSPGRRRRKVAIGIHDAKGLEGPFTYTTVGPGERPFVPLNGSRPMTPAEILAQHPKGQEYGHLVPAPAAAAERRFPVFLDGKGEVVSMPPVINAQRTAVTAATRDLLLDVTGTDARAVRQTIALLATCLAERGGAIEAVTVHDASGTWTAPDLKPSEHVLHTDDVAALLGLTWTGDNVAECLRRMGHGAQAYDNKVHVQVGAWRQDILHAVDLIEDVGIGHGFDRFPGELPRVATYGAALPHQDLEDALRSLMVGHGAHEAKTLTLSDPRQQWKNWGEAEGAAVTLLNPVAEEQTLLRVRLLPSLLAVLATNRHRSLPQRLFEVGYAVQESDGAWGNRLRFAYAEVAAKAGFSEAKGLVQAILRDASLPLRLEAGDVPGFIPGRSGHLMLGRQRVGHFGELHPDTLVAFGLAAPAIGIEFGLDGL
jgi:phenylalanyl-tRNA synthetase beta chain